MKGIGIFGLLASIAILLVLIFGVINMRLHLLEEHGTIDRFTEPIRWDKGIIEATGEKIFKQCEDFLDVISNYIPINYLERECSRWYKKCTADMEKAPQSPWTKLTHSEQDLNAITYLKFDCKTDGIEDIREEWARENSYFAGKSEEEQYNLIKNACAATLVDKIK